MKNQADTYYKQLIETVDRKGVWDTDTMVRTRWKDGSPAHTKSWISQSITFDNTEVPILTTKKVAWQSAIKEMLWIWQMKSNVVQDLRDMGVTIWNEWELPDGSIGKAYGYQLAKKNRKVKDRKYMDVKGDIKWIYKDLDQVDYLLKQLKENPSSRRHITTLWNPDDLDEMSLTPCVYETQWHVKEGKLHLEVGCRSNDVGLGMPFNIFQYHVLHRMIAQVTGYEVGQFKYKIGDLHIYDRHLEPLKEQIQRDVFTPPTLWINPDIKNFYDFTIDDFELRDYQHGEKVPLEIAI
jgi:thymidylate synthase